MASAGWLLLACAVLFALAGPGTHAQASCQSWEGEPAECEPYLRYHTPAHLPYPIVYSAGQAAQAEAARALMPLALNAAPTHCRKAVAQLACLSVFPACTSVPLGNTSLALPRFACRSVCEGVNAACRASGVQVECEQLEPTTGLPLYPLQGSEFLPNVTVPCFGHAGTPPGKIKVACPSKFVYSRDDDQCQVRCPEMYSTYSHTEMTVLYVIRWIGLGLAVPVCVMFIVPAFAVKSRRIFPTYVPAVFAFCYLALVISWTIGLWVFNTDDWLCSDEAHLRTKDHAGCFTQGVLATFFTAATTTWFALMCFNIMMPILSATWRQHVKTRAVEVAEHALGWSVPTAHALQTAIRGNIEMVPDLALCTVASTSGARAVEDQVITSSGLMAGSLFVLTSVLCLVYSKFALHLNWGLKTALKNTWKSTSRPLLFSMLFSIVALYSSFFVWFIWATAPRLEDRLTEYGECHAEGRSDCEVDDVQPFPTYVVFFIMLMPYTTVALFLIFARRKWVRSFWLSCGTTVISTSQSKSNTPNQNA